MRIREMAKINKSTKMEGTDREIGRKKGKKMIIIKMMEGWWRKTGMLQAQKKWWIQKWIKVMKIILEDEDKDEKGNESFLDVKKKCCNEWRNFQIFNFYVRNLSAIWVINCNLIIMCFRASTEMAPLPPSSNMLNAAA